ncbi:MAG: nucleotidyltransferase domain-containing protein [Candidatus Binatia bacterium]
MALRRRDPVVELVGCIGSYARNDWGVGSDLDVIVMLSDTCLSPVQRHAKYDPPGLAVPVDLWVYTRREWEALSSQAPQFWERLQREMLDLTVGQVA